MMDRAKKSKVPVWALDAVGMVLFAIVGVTQNVPLILVALALYVAYRVFRKLDKGSAYPEKNWVSTVRSR